MPIRPIILCGGAGTRLWPTSRESLPKQFAPLLGKRSTFQETVLRLRGEGFHDRPIVVTGRGVRFIVDEQLADIGAVADILVEPARRDSGPAVLAGALWAARDATDSPVLVVAADHAVRDAGRFRDAVRGAEAAARSGRIVTFGIEPSHPATEYGYVEPGQPLREGAWAVSRFVEKPDAARAARYLLSGYLWNSGNFLFVPSALVAEYARLDEATTEAVRAAVEGALPEAGAWALAPEPFERARARSLDYAVLEHTGLAAVAPLACGWSDVGNWDALWSLGERDGDGNVQHGATEVVDSRNCYVTSDGPLTSVLGVSDLVVVAHRDAVLVADRRRTGEVKTLVQTLRRKHRPEADTHARVRRPWGWYEVIDRGEGFQVKRIVVQPQGRLSLQSHRHRAEHWVVVSGSARVTIGERINLLGPNQHTYIPLGAVHRLENPGNAPIELIEVQSGDYLGEDDIVRFEDVYGRA